MYGVVFCHFLPGRCEFTSGPLPFPGGVLPFVLWADSISRWVSEIW
jgi:hypothetical protein